VKADTAVISDLTFDIGFLFDCFVFCEINTIFFVKYLICLSYFSLLYATHFLESGL